MDRRRPLSSLCTVVVPVSATNSSFRRRVPVADWDRSAYDDRPPGERGSSPFPVDPAPLPVQSGRVTALISHTTFDSRDAYAMSVFWAAVLGFAEDPDDP